MTPWTLLIALGAFVLVLAWGPWLVPVPPLRDTVPPRALADPDSLFLSVEGLEVHYKRAGAGQPVFVLLHGFGASTFSWREVWEPLAQLGTVVVYDRPGFGLTKRPLPTSWKGLSPYSPEFQPQLAVGLLDALGIERAVFVGHSAGGAVAVQIALEHPERVEALVLVAPALGGGGELPDWLRFVLRTPQLRHLGPLFVRRLAGEAGLEAVKAAWHDPSLVTEEVIAGYRKPLRAENWDRALWEIVRESHPLGIAAQLGEIQVPVLVVTGDDDRAVPLEQSQRVAQAIPGAQFVVISSCGHIPHEERPAEFMDAVRAFLSRLGR